MELLQSLRFRIDKKHSVYDQICGRVQSAATPKQVVKFLMWITKNTEGLSRHISGFSHRSHSHIPNIDIVNQLMHDNTSTATHSLNSQIDESEHLINPTTEF